MLRKLFVALILTSTVPVVSAAFAETKYEHRHDKMMLNHEREMSRYHYQRERMMHHHERMMHRHEKMMHRHERMMQHRHYNHD